MTHNPFYHLESIFSLNSRCQDTWSISSPRTCYPENCIIYVLDSGLDVSHTEFQFSDIEVLSTAKTGNDHATKLVSLINGASLGVAPDTKLCFIDINSEDVFFDVLQKHREKNKDKIGIILCAWQLPDLEPELQDVMQNVFMNLLDDNNILITACGNKGLREEFEFPTTIDHPCNVVVGSHDVRGYISKFNNKTEFIQPRIFAPGRRILTADKDNKYDESTGSSYAAAIVAGCVSYFCEDSLTNTNVVRNLMEQANKDKLSWKDLPERVSNNSVFIGVRPKTHKLPALVPIDNLGFMKRNKDGNDIYSDIPEHTKRGISNILDDILLPLRNKDIVVPLSGGTDSEWVTRTLYERDIRFNAKTVRYWFNGENLNKHDISNINWKYVAEHQYIDLDVREFFEGGTFLHYMTHYETPSPQLCTHLWLLDQTQGFFIFAGDMLYEKDGTWTRPTDLYFCYDLYKLKQKREGISRLWCANGELTRKIEMLSQKAESEGFGKDKHSVLLQMGYDINKREEEFTGFEILKERYHQQTDCYRYFDRRFRGLC